MPGTAFTVSALALQNKMPGREDNVFPYYFDIQGYGEERDDRGGTLMPNDEAALAYARRIIRELRKAGGYDDPALSLIVRNAVGETVYSLPLLQH
jgi:hypothetical protein